MSRFFFCVRRSLAAAAWAVAIICLATPAVRAQSTTGIILGTITDSSGAVLPGATITVTHIATGLVRSTASESSGTYQITALPPGVYRVDVALDGFKGLRHDNVQLEVGANQRVDSKLELGSISEQITVSADALHVDTSSASVGVVIDSDRLEKLPMVGRGTLNLALLSPGVGSATLPATVTNQRNGPTISAGGARPNQSNVMLDGASLRTAAFNTAQSLPSPDSLQEFQVLTSTYPAQYGEAGGATLMAITKSGTNTLTGTAWEYFRNDKLTSKNFFAPTKPTLKQNQPGFTIGGPVFKNKTFFFGNYEAIRIQTQAINRFFSPTAAQRAGDFSSTATAIKDPLTGIAFPGNQIPVSRFDPMAVNIVNTYLPLPNTGAEQIELVDRPTNGNQITVKGDHRFSASDTANVRYYWNKTTGITAQGNINALNYPLTNIVQGTAASGTHIFKNNLVSEARFTYTTITTDQGYSTANKSPEQLGALWSSNTYPEPRPIVPQITVTGAFSMNAGNQNWNERGRLAQADYKMTWNTAGHALTYGGGGLWQLNRSHFPFQVGGVFTFSGASTGNAMADFLLGNTSNFSQFSCLCSQETQGQWRAFLQDDWRVASRVTVNLGLRYEGGSTWVEQDLHNSTFRLGQQSTRFPNAPLGLVSPGDAGVPNTIIPADNNNFAPRLGVAWDVRGNGRTAVRAGWGIYYLPMPAQAIEQQNENAPFTQSQVFTPPASVTMYNVYAGQVQPFPFQYEEGAATKRFALPTQVFAYDTDFHTAFMHQYNANIQQQFGQDLIVQVGYVGSLGRNMLYGREINAAVFGPGATAANAQSRRPIDPTSYTSIIKYFSDSTSRYDSLQLTVTKKYSKSYTVQGTYAYGKSYDDRSTTSTAASAQNPLDPHTGEWALSDFDRRHILRINGLWEAPALSDSKVLRNVLGGWRVAGIVSFLSGQPVNIVSGSDRALLGASSRGLGPQRPDLIADASLPTNRTQAEKIAKYFNTAAYVLPALGTFGNAPRNNVTGPGVVTVDASLAKRFEPWSGNNRRSIEFRVEAFNLLNRVNLGAPINSLNSAAFGQIQSTSTDARLVQLGVHFGF